MSIMKNIIYKISFSLILLICILGNQLSASHVAGGQITYKCLGNDTYQVTLEFRRDCFNGDPLAQFDDPVSIGIFDNEGNLIPSVGNLGELFIPFNDDDTLNETQTSECRVLGSDVCVQTTIYQKELTLPFRAGGYVLAYQRCCRNGSLSNIIDPTLQGSTYWIEITEQAMLECNSSANFKNWPSVYLCADQEFEFDHSATDVDGDSLVYSLCRPYIGGTSSNAQPQPPSGPDFENVFWATGFDIDNLMGGVPLTIDSETGIMTATPGSVGQFLIGVCVEEYRNGMLLNRVIRDFEYNVRICLENPTAEFELSTDMNCEGLDISLMNFSSPTAEYQWYFDYPENTLSSNLQNPDVTYLEGGIYTVQLIVDEEGCVDSTFQTVSVSSPDDPGISFSANYIDCLDSLIVYIEDTITSNQVITIVEWTVIGPDTMFTIQGDLESFELTQQGSYDISFFVENESGCNQNITQTYDFILLEEDPQLDFSIDYLDCLNELTIYIDAEIISEVDINTIEWTFQSEDTLLNIVGPLDSLHLGEDGIYTISLFAENVLGCNQMLTQEFNFVLTPIDFEIEPDLYIICEQSMIQLNENPNPNYSFVWESNPPGIISDPTESSPVVMVEEYTEFYISAFFGNCTAFDTVIVDPQGLEVEPINTIEEQFFYCEGGSVTVFAEATADADFVWYDENGVELGMGTPLTFVPDNAQQISVIATNEFNCMDTAFVNISINDFGGEIMSDDVVCVDEVFDLEVINFEDPLQEFSFQWSPASTILSSSGPNAQAQITETTEFTVLATDQLGCIFEITHTVEVDPFQTFLITVDPDNFLLTESTQLSVDDLPNVTYEWSPSETLDDPTISNPIATPDSDGIVYTVTVTNENGCVAIASVSLSVVLPQCDENDIFVPNMFTPNGDNFNDVFKPESNFIDELEMVVYSRWGEEVFKTNDPAGGWDGTFDGAELTPDVYGYYMTILCINGERFTKKGNVTIIK